MDDVVNIFTMEEIGYALILAAGVDPDSVQVYDAKALILKARRATEMRNGHRHLYEFTVVQDYG